MQVQSQSTDIFTSAYHIFTIITGIGTLLGALAFAVYVVRSNSYRLLAKEWEELAQVKAAKIVELEKKLALLETKIELVLSENEALRSLNIELQNKMQKREIS